MQHGWLLFFCKKYHAKSWKEEADDDLIKIYHDLFDRKSSEEQSHEESVQLIIDSQQTQNVLAQAPSISLIQSSHIDFEQMTDNNFIWLG